MNLYKTAIVLAIGIAFLGGVFLGRELVQQGGASRGERSHRATPPVPSALSATTQPGVTGTPEEDNPPLPLDVKIGQMVMAGFPTEAAATSMIGEQHIGNVLLFAENVVSPSQVLALTQALQEAALRENGQPLLIAVDQEGGEVTRLGAVQGFTEFAEPAVLGCIADPRLTRDVGETMGNEMRAVGINLDLAPVLDVNDNPANPVIGVRRRAFSASPEQVSIQAQAFIAGLHDAGLAATGKHFPGHGSTNADSHVVLPVVDKTREELEQTELLPFRSAVANAEIDAVMTAHVLYPALDVDYPATLSKRIVGDLLREELGFDGLVITDSLSMGAIRNNWTVAEAGVLAVEAGADLLVVPSPTLAVEVSAGIRNAVESGRLPEDQINQAVARVLALKERIQAGPASGDELSVVASDMHRAIAQRVTDSRAGC